MWPVWRQSLSREDSRKDPVSRAAVSQWSSAALRRIGIPGLGRLCRHHEERLRPPGRGCRGPRRSKVPPSRSPTLSEPGSRLRPVPVGVGRSEDPGTPPSVRRDSTSGPYRTGQDRGDQIGRDLVHRDEHLSGPRLAWVTALKNSRAQRARARRGARSPVPGRRRGHRTCIRESRVRGRSSPWSEEFE
jgi:hypothetical protein